MDRLRHFIERIAPFLTRKNMELAALVLILLCAFLVYSSGRQKQAVLKFKDATMVYEGQVIRDKPSGRGKISFPNGDSYEGDFESGAFDGKGIFKAGAGWSYDGQFKDGLAHGKGRLKTETGAVYKGEFKQGVYQDAD